jgi:3',5'-cyclic AMP phosphodiesterase CpdA
MLRRHIFLLFLIVILIIPSVNARTPESLHFYFVQITDTHFGEGDNLKRTERIIQAINKLPVEVAFVAHTGDITQNRIYDEETIANGLSCLNRLKAPIHFVAGNHDILSYDLEETIEIYQENFGKLFDVVQYNGVACYFLYTGPMPKSDTRSGYPVIDWLEDSLKEFSDKPILIFQHIPPATDFYNNRFHEPYTKTFLNKWRELLSPFPVKAIICGHFHRDELHWFGDIPVFVSAPISGAWKRQSTFRIYEYRDGKVAYRTQYVN